MPPTVMLTVDLNTPLASTACTVTRCAPFAIANCVFTMLVFEAVNFLLPSTHISIRRIGFEPALAVAVTCTGELGVEPFCGEQMCTVRAVVGAGQVEVAEP